MKVCVVGAGGLGGLFGGWLADAGVDVSFIARGAHLAALKDTGLQIFSPLGDRHLRKVVATHDPGEIGEVDVVLMCVKNYDLTATAQQCSPLMGADTAVISVLNGVNAPDVMAEFIDPKHVIAGLTYLPSNLDGPGVIRHKSDFLSIMFGTADGTIGQNISRFHSACVQAGIDATMTPDIAAALWTKFIGWSASSAITSISRQPIGVLQRMPELKALFAGVSGEAFAVAQAQGIALPDDTLERLMSTFETFPPGAKSSTLVDLEQGNALEIDAGVGTVIRLAEKAGIDVPISRTIYAGLLPFRDGTPKA